MITITEFLEKCAGKWFSQRTGHNLVDRKSVLGKGDLWMDLLAADAPEAIALCQRYGVDPGAIAAGLKLRWEGITASPNKELGSSTIVALAPDENGQGLLLATPAAAELLKPGTYSFGTDGTLWLNLPLADGTIEERIWFASDNLRFRSSTTTRSNGMTFASFCSEIRMGVTPPKAA
jgi:hypothetical protein